MQQIKSLRREAGQSLVEFTLTLPLVLLIVLGVVDLGLGFKTYISLTNAAREGVRWVTIHPSDVTGAEARVDGEAARVGLLSGGEGAGYTVSFSPAKAAYSAGDEVTVTIGYNYELMFGAITGLPSVPFQAHATMTVLYDATTP